MFRETSTLPKSIRSRALCLAKRQDIAFLGGGFGVFKRLNDGVRRKAYLLSSILFDIMAKGKKNAVSRLIPGSTELLKSLRAKMKDLNITAFICGSADAHQSEYVCERDQRRAFISGFTGSAGTALILQDKALLWTDGRYFLQASKELSSDWTLMRSNEIGVLEMEPWLQKHMNGINAIVGFDGNLMSAEQASSLTTNLQKNGIILKPVSNPIDELWETQPEVPMKPVLIMEGHGNPHSEKIAMVQSFLKEQGAYAFCASMLDETAWLFNIRGADVECNPVTIAYSVITIDGAHLFCDKRKLGKDVLTHLGVSDDDRISNGKRKRGAQSSSCETVNVHPYEDVQGFLENIVSRGQRVAIDRKQLNYTLYLSAGGSNALHVTSPLTMAKSVKNKTELDGIRAAHVRDGVALTAFLHWLDNAVRASPGSITECDAAERLETFRGAMSGHKYPSFPTIAGYGPNGAIIHYKPENATCATIGTNSLFLLDSGGQYVDGTTDVTRTLHFGNKPTQRMKDCYTAVLQGHIGLARLVFPEGTLGSRFDAIARLPLWGAGLDYLHGTGHGVGAFLNVHEGPQGIGYRKRDNEEGFRIGMTTSNEPGYYEEGSFGIRIENVCIIVEAKTANNFAGRKYCALETVTKTPINTALINKKMLSPEDIKWINDYHQDCREKLLPGMKQHFPQAVSYLMKETEPI